MTTIALLGNPNVGKTTLFNELTGSNQYVGNWAGVTVEKKEGFYKDIKIVDLPGIYAMDTFSNEEKVSKAFLEEGNVDAILNIVDASNLQRNLYLTTQLKDFNIPIILILNMMDIVLKKGFLIDIDLLEKEMGVTVVPISATKGTGLEHIKDLIEKKDFVCPSTDNDFHMQNEAEVYGFLDKILSKILVNKNSYEAKKINEKNHEFIKKLNVKEAKISDISEKLDKVFLNPFLAYPLFLVAVVFIFKFTFSWVGIPLSDWLDETVLQGLIIPGAENLLSTSSDWFKSLIIDGIITGVGSIVVLLPVILALFLCISILEDSGYMARVAFIMDKLMRRMGLSGKAFIPMMVGFGCSVPAIMSARTLESEKDRKLTALLVPFMSCNARLPVYLVFSSVFFRGKEALVVGSLYLAGVVVAFILGILFKNTIFKKDEEPFIIELPEYKVPEVKNVIKHTWDKGSGFLKKAGTIIFSMSVVIWFLSNFNFSGLVDEINTSFLASIGNVIAPFFAPLGFGNWQASVSLLTGLLAKETVVSTMGVIYAGDLSTLLPSFFNFLTALSFMVFVLLYTPCVSAIGTMKKEFGSKFTLFSVVFQLAIAWVAAFAVYNIGGLLF
ncbi:ferrous iron transport protein B [Clostridium sp. YIM B02551]|uniref:ferrous iron transport protein B n=1 Tax=Clostridium sp. YIM B02551 TaxID=2910679 RepID=UPI001EE9CDE9|nr:ferrous iron transport protein B [Clostridium sp. YIM B02551]